MSRLAIAVSLALSATSVLAQTPHFPYTALPYQAYTDNGPRGTQAGYNRCNATTEGPTSLCQTAMVNSLDDFCVWGPSKPDSSLGVTEAESVAWCTKPGRGTRLIPPGALTGVQFMRTPDYVQVTGHINQAMIDLAKDDGGGELDPHGADGLGNPLGGLVYSNAFPSNAGKNNTFQQVIEWHNFMGDDQFCFKVCDPAGKNAAHFCEHVFDRLGCFYNAPAAYEDNVFQSCEGESQDFPGVYTGVDGKTSIFKQPAQSLGAISSMPYEPRVPASSNCVTFPSTALYSTAVPSSSAASSSAAASGRPSGSGAAKSAPHSTAVLSSSGTPKANGASTPSPISAAFWSSMLVVLGGVAVGVTAL